MNEDSARDQSQHTRGLIWIMGTTKGLRANSGLRGTYDDQAAAFAGRVDVLEAYADEGVGGGNHVEAAGLARAGGAHLVATGHRHDLHAFLKERQQVTLLLASFLTVHNLLFLFRTHFEWPVGGPLAGLVGRRVQGTHAGREDARTDKLQGGPESEINGEK